MQSSSAEFRLMVAPAAGGRWVRAAEEGLAPLPVDLIWSRSVDDAIRLLTDRPVHAAFVDDALPAIGGLELLRRFRRLGWALPCVLVSDAVEPRLLQAALEVSAFSVLNADTASRGFADVALRIARQCYQMDWPSPN